MTGTLVLDSSAVVALLSDKGSVGDWVASTLDHEHLAAPHLVMFEAADVLRRLGRAGHLSDNEAVLAYDGLQQLPVELWPFGALAERVWSLRPNLTAYDAAYVALADLLDARLVTLDGRLARATAPRCEVLVPPPA